MHRRDGTVAARVLLLPLGTMTSYYTPRRAAAATSGTSRSQGEAGAWPDAAATATHNGTSGAAAARAHAAEPLSRGGGAVGSCAGHPASVVASEGGQDSAGANVAGLPSWRGARELVGSCSSFYDRDKRRRNRDLRDLIRAQPDISGILDLVAERGEFWDAIGVSTALHSAAWRCRQGAQRPDFAGDSRWLLLRELVLAKLSVGEARNLANNAWSLASMASSDWPLLGHIAAGVLRVAAELKVQEVSNTCWALATVKWSDEPLFCVLATEMLAKAEDGVNQDLTNTLWAYATVPCAHEPLFQLLCDLALARVVEFKPQELANAVWALATSALKHEALTLRVSRQALGTLPEFTTQNVANFLWAYAKLGYDEEVVIYPVQAEIIQRLHQFAMQDLSTAAWAFATMAHRDDRFLKSCSTVLRSRVRSRTALLPQHASNTLWAFATLNFRDGPCFADVTASVAKQLGAFKTQEVSNAVWACAASAYREQSFTDDIAREAARRLQDFDPQGIGNATWAVTMLTTTVREMYARVWERMGDSAVLMHCSDKVFSMLVVALFRGGEADMAWRLFDRVALNRVNPGIAAFGTWLHHCRQRQPDHSREIQVLLHCAKLRPCRHVMLVVLNMVVLRLKELGETGHAVQVLGQMEADGAGDIVTQLLRDQLLGGQEADGSMGGGVTCKMDWHVPLRIRGNPRCDYEKECQLLRYVMATSQPGDPVSVIESIERFSVDGNGWLKIAGDEKGAVLDDLVRVLAPSPPRLVVEFGCYVGYSACRMARILRPNGGRFLSVEVDPIHACIARSVLEFAGLADTVSIYIGHSEEAIPHLPETCNGVPADAVFMDQRGTRFHIDLQALEDLGLLAPGCVVTADNVLKPGAPHFLWHLQHCERYSLTVVSLREFAAERIEDWMAVARYCPEAHGSTATAEFPEELEELAYRTDRVRARSCAGENPGEVTEDDWACHSQDIRRSYAAVGITPRVVQVLRREDGTPFVDW